MFIFLTRLEFFRLKPKPSVGRQGMAVVRARTQDSLKFKPEITDQSAYHTTLQLLNIEWLDYRDKHPSHNYTAPSTLSPITWL